MVSLILSQHVKYPIPIFIYLSKRYKLYVTIPIPMISLTYSIKQTNPFFTLSGAVVNTWKLNNEYCSRCRSTVPNQCHPIPIQQKNCVTHNKFSWTKKKKDKKNWDKFCIFYKYKIKLCYILCAQLLKAWSLVRFEFFFLFHSVYWFYSQIKLVVSRVDILFLLLATIVSLVTVHYLYGAATNISKLKYVRSNAVLWVHYGICNATKIDPEGDASM